MKTKRLSSILLPAMLLLAGCNCGNPSVELEKDILLDKIKGAWAGQTFGCAYGGPTEFRFNGVTIPDSLDFGWDGDNLCRWYHDNAPGLYDDIYMDLTSLDVLDRLGMDAPAASFA
mgnify:CR=1 FL=1